jgi:EAL domain-containing protein (putative c-di-GMP-specific phosphodiesterase class I)
MAELRELGVRIAIDDFGTGHSAIASLRRLPIDMLKIDESFIARLGPDSQANALAKAMVSIGEALDMHIVVEGVERADQVELLKAFGCEVAQGFFFGRPMDAQALTNVLLQDRLRLRQLR